MNFYRLGTLTPRILRRVLARGKGWRRVLGLSEHAPDSDLFPAMHARHRKLLRALRESKGSQQVHRERREAARRTA